jgi:hypothetical protein
MLDENNIVIFTITTTTTTTGAFPDSKLYFFQYVISSHKILRPNTDNKLHIHIAGIQSSRKKDTDERKNGYIIFLEESKTTTRNLN